MDQPDSIAYASDSPKVDLLLELFRDSGIGGYSNNQQLADQTRLCVWDHQSPDGKKWDVNFKGDDDARAFPWDGASDVRTYTADGVINEHVAMLQMAFWRSQIKASGVGLDDLGDAAAARTFLEWLKTTKLLGQLDAEVELLAQYTTANRWAAMQVTWEREIAIRMQPVEMVGLQALAAGVAQEDPQGQDPATELLLAFPRLIADPIMEPEAIAAAQFVYRRFAEAELPADLLESDIPTLSNKRARAVVRELRETGKTEVPMPYLSKNQPCFTALEPWVDICVPGDPSDLQSAPVIFIREWLSEAELLGKALTEGWNPEFIEMAQKTKGSSSAWHRDRHIERGDEALWEWEPEAGRHQNIEILHAYRRAVDEDGVSAVYLTTLSPHFSKNDSGQEVVAKHGVLNYPHGKYPVVELRRERLGRGLNRGRGVAEMVITHQNEEKTQRDGLVDFTSIAVVPPLNIAKGAMKGKYRFGPAVQNEVAPGREPRLLDIPNRGAPIAVTLLELLRQKLARQFGLIDASVPPALVQMMQESQVRRFLIAMSEAMQMAWQLCLRFAPDVIERVTGIRPAAADSVLAMADQHDILLSYDVAELQPELLAQKLTAFSELLPEDTEGVIDKVKLVGAKARMIDPTLAAELVTDQGSATQQLFNQVANDFVQMFLGNKARLTDASNDPTGPARARFAQQILGGNPRYLSALDPKVAAQVFGEQGAQAIAAQAGGGQPDPLFSNQVADYFKNLAQAQKQQENKQRGRIGV